jgi:biotin transporter BioY
LPFSRLNNRRLFAVSLAAITLFEMIGIVIARFAADFGWALSVVAALPGPIVVAVLWASLGRARVRRVPSD